MVGLQELMGTVVQQHRDTFLTAVLGNPPTPFHPWSHLLQLQMGEGAMTVSGGERGTRGRWGLCSPGGSRRPRAPGRFPPVRLIPQTFIMVVV